MNQKFEEGLDRCQANYSVLSPLSLLARTVSVYPNKTAVIYDSERYDYATFYNRCCRLSSAIKLRGIGTGDTVAVMAPNVPAVLEAHFGVPMAGAVLNTLNIRLDAEAIAFQLTHGEARMVLVDPQYRSLIDAAVSKMEIAPLLIDIEDPSYGQNARVASVLSYEQLLTEGDPGDPWVLPDDEWKAITLNYTSGTTGNPKGVVFHHRGAYLESLGNVIALGLDDKSVYLWTLPMFHCNGWTFTWAVTAAGGTHICLRNTEPISVFEAIGANGVTHMCGAPIILNMLIHAPEDVKQRPEQPVRVATGGAAPSSSVLRKMEHMGFEITHVYGLTETFGPATYCARQADWELLDPIALSNRIVRQGVRYHTMDDIRICDPTTLVDVPADGETLGEIMFRGNTVMKGYLKNPETTQEAFRGGWFHSGDLGVMHPDGYIEVKDRSKDIIISGGENISSLEIEEVLYQHHRVREAAVVARPDAKWGESPCAFVALDDRPDPPSEVDLIAFCREHMAHYKSPKTIVFTELPKTSTGKIQKYILRDRAKKL